MSAFVIGQLNIINEKPYKKYVEQTTPIIKKFGGEFLVRGGKFKNVWGNWSFSRNVVIKFKTFQDATDWYNSKEYEPVKKIREENSIGNLIIIEGF